MTGKRYFFALSILYLVLFLAGNVCGQDANEVLEKYFDAVSNGDVLRWSRLKSVYIESTCSYSNGAANQSAPTLLDTKASICKIYRVWPDLYRLDLWSDSILQVTVITVNKKGFIKMGNAPPMPTSPGPYDDSFEFMPVTISKAMKKAKSIVLKGVEVVDGLRCYEVELVTRQLTWRLYFDETTYLLNYWSNSPDNEFVSMTKVFDYVEREGMKFSMSETKSRNGVMFFWSHTTLLGLNKDIDPRIFQLDPK